MWKANNQKGMTLLEVLAVMVILGIFSAIAVPSVTKVFDNNDKKQHIANAQRLKEIAEMMVAIGEVKFDGTDSNVRFISLHEMEQQGWLVKGELRNPSDDNKYYNLPGNGGNLNDDASYTSLKERGYKLDEIVQADGTLWNNKGTFVRVVRFEGVDYFDIILNGKKGSTNYCFINTISSNGAVDIAGGITEAILNEKNLDNLTMDDVTLHTEVGNQKIHSSTSP